MNATQPGAGESQVASGPIETEAQKRARVGGVLASYARSVQRMNERGDWPVDSGQVPIMKRAAEYIGQLERQRDAAHSAKEQAERRGNELEEDAEIGRAVRRACGELPDGYEIELALERGAGTVRLIDLDGHPTDDFSGDGFVDYINSAIDAALAIGRERGD